MGFLVNHGLNESIGRHRLGLANGQGEILENVFDGVERHFSNEGGGESELGGLELGDVFHIFDLLLRCYLLLTTDESLRI